jgi:hypothetical protein
MSRTIASSRKAISTARRERPACRGRRLIGCLDCPRDCSIIPRMGRVAFLVMALATAGMAAMMTGSIAHDEFGIPLDAIRSDALSAAGLIFAATACASLLTRK